MNHFPRIVSVAFAAIATAAAPLVAEPPTWAFLPAAPAAAAAPDDGSAKHVPGSTVALTKKQIASHGPEVPDWHPEEHPVPPEIVAKGREPLVWACGYCHLLTGAGRPENASLAGLTAAYIKQQVLAFKNGERPGSDPKRGPQTNMINVAKAANDAEIAEAAAYFASLKPVSFVKVVEAGMVPRTSVVGTVLARLPDGGTEPIGNRIVEVPEELERFDLRDSRTTYVAYVPPGSLKRGAELVTTGGAGKTLACSICHGPDLRGLADIPRLAGRSPSFLMRQLVDFKGGARTDSNSVLMKPTVANLSEEDMLAIAAYVASLAP